MSGHGDFVEGQNAMQHYIKLKMMEDLDAKYMEIMATVAQHFSGRTEEKDKFGKVMKILLKISKCVLETEYAEMFEDALKSSELVTDKIQKLLLPMENILNVIGVVYAGTLDSQESSNLFAILEYMTIRDFNKIKEAFGSNQAEITKLHQQRQEFSELLKSIRELVLKEVYEIGQ